MNQLPSIPALGLTLLIPRDQVQRAIEGQLAKGAELLRERASSPEMMENLKRQHWNWTLETCNLLKACFTSEAASSYFASNVFFEPSLKFDDFQRDLDEFPPTVRGKLERLHAFIKVLPIIPEPPCGDFIGAQFHPKIYHVAWKPFERAQYGVAINAAVQEIEDAVKLAVAGNINENGAELVRKAFDPEGGPLFDPEASAADNASTADLLAGFFTRFKSMAPNAVIDIHQTARILTLASFLMYLMDARQPKKQEVDTAPPVDFEFLKPD